MSVVAIDLGGSKVVAASVSPRGTLRGRVEEPVDTSSVEAGIDQIARLATQIGGDALGVAVPGLVRRNGTVWAPNLPGWTDVPLARELEKKLGMPAFVESDRNSVVVGEAWRGAARGKSDVIVLIIGTGIGAGIMSGGSVIRGAHELSGCAGWMIVTDEDKPSRKKSGSLEALVAGPAIAKAFGVASAVDVAELARRRDHIARKIFANAARHLGRAIANLISLFDPEVVVLTGGLVHAADLFLDDVKRTARDYAQPLSFPEVDIVVSTLGTEANLLGVARLALESR
jgi:glucokinase